MNNLLSKIGIAVVPLTMISILGLTRVQPPDSHLANTSPHGGTAITNPEILAFADRIGTALADQRTGRYLKAAYEEWVRMNEDQVMGSATVRWTSADGGGGQLTSPPRTWPASMFTSTDYPDDLPHADRPDTATAVQDWSHGPVWTPFCAPHQSLRPQMDQATDNLVNRPDQVLDYTAAVYTRIRLSRACRVDLLYTLAHQPGAHLGHQTDPRGRRGTTIYAYTESSLDTLYFDDTGVLLAYISLECQADRRSGLRYALILDHLTVTDQIDDPG